MEHKAYCPACNKELKWDGYIHGVWVWCPNGPCKNLDMDEGAFGLTFEDAVEKLNEVYFKSAGIQVRT